MKQNKNNNDSCVSFPVKHLLHLFLYENNNQGPNDSGVVIMAIDTRDGSPVIIKQTSPDYRGFKIGYEQLRNSAKNIIRKSSKE